jgi:hypothetical protein
MVEPNHEAKKGLSLGPVATTLLLPVLLPSLALIVLCSIPYTKIAIRRYRKREDTFKQSMREKGRIVTWEELAGRLASGRGTMLIENTGFKGAFRVWWTDENPMELCPFPFEENRAEREDAAQWCNFRYTSEGGTALLVERTNEDWRQIEGANLYQGIYGDRSVEIFPIPPK